MQNLYFIIHLTSLALAAGGILIADHSALTWIRGKVDVVSPRLLLRLHWLVTIGLCGLIATGLLMFWPMRAYLMQEPQFWLKMSFVAALIVNSFIIDRLMHKATTHPFKSLTLAQKMPLFISGGISTLCWAGAATLAFFLLP